MAETELRALLQCVSEHPSDYFHRYRMFEALVEAVELQDTPTAATFRKLRVEFWAERRKLECEVLDSRKELAKAEAEIERLQKQRDALRQGISEHLEEIERLRKQRDAFQGDLGEALRGREYQIREKVDAHEALVDARAAIKNEQRKVTRLQGLFEDAQQMLAAPNMAYERQAADAEVGRLVRGMRLWSRLGHGWSATVFWVDVADPPDDPGDWKRIPGIHDDPAEALRSIQEVGDAKT